jgi:multidrug efflux system membrane fusion protein
MKVDFRGGRQSVLRQRGRSVAIVVVLLLLAAAAAFWFWRSPAEAPKAKEARPVPVVSALVTVGDIPVRLSANGLVSALQSVEVRPQISATIKAVHVKEGQFVRQGQRLFSLDVRTEDANIGKSEAQGAKTRVDLANAERNLQRQRDLFNQKFISQTALDTVQSQVEGLRAQAAADQATVETSRVARGFGEIVAPISGRLGAIAVYPGSLVQPSGAALVSIAQIDPINVGFSVPESALSAVQKRFASGDAAVFLQVDGDGANSPAKKGRLSFIDNSVDSASGTIRLKATFANADGRLWPGMFVTVALSPQTLVDALSVPVQAVQTGPEKKFVYLIGAEGKVSALPIRVRLVQDGRAVIEGVAAGAKVVVEGAQNLRPGSVVTEAKKEPAAAVNGASKKPSAS